MENVKSVLAYKTLKGLILPEDIQKAADEDFIKQTTYNKSFDRKLGFIAGAKWALKLAGIKFDIVNVETKK